MKLVVSGLVLSIICAAASATPELSNNWTSEGAIGGISSWTGHDSVMDADGSVYTILRNPILNGPNQLVAAQIRSDGTPGWTSYLAVDGADFYYPGEVALDNDGNIYFSAYVWRASAVTLSLMTAKVDATGAEQWRRERSQRDGWLSASAIRLTNAGQVISAGRGRPPGQNSNGVFVTSHDVNGNFLWERLIGDPLVNVLERVRIETDSAGNIWVLGADEGGNGPFLVKLNSTGDIVWQGHPAFQADSSTMEQLLIDTDDAIYVVHRDSSPGQLTWVWRFASDGSDAGQWSIPSPVGFSDRYYSAAVVGINDLVLTGGRVSQFNLPSNILVTRASASGVLWSIEYSGLVDTIGHALALRHDQSVVAVGGYSIEASSDTAAIVHVSSRGELVGASRIDLGEGIGEFCSEVMLRPTGAVCAGVTRSGGLTRQMASSWNLDQLSATGFE